MQLFLQLLQTSCVAAIAIVAIALLRTLSRNKVDRRVFIALWLLVIAQLLTISSLSLPSLSTQARVSSSSVEVVNEEAVVLPVEVRNNFSPVADHADIVDKTKLGTISERSVFWVFIVWLVGSVAMTTGVLLIYVLFYYESKKAMPITEINCLKYFDGIKVFLNDRISSPVTLGVFRPEVHLPFTFDLSDEKLMEHVLLHESIHAKRYDNLLKFLALMALCLHWFNPSVWLLVRLLNKDIEFSCDAKAVKKLGEQKRAEYANTLLLMAQSHLGTNLAGMVFVSFGGSFLKERVLSIMKTKSSIVLSMLLAVLFTFGVFTVFAAPAQNNLSFEKAKEIALKKVGSGFVSKSELDYENGKIVYEIDVLSGSNKYEIKIDADNGNVIRYGRTYNISALTAPPQKNLIGEDRAMQIALERVGTGTVIKLEEDYEDGILKYDVEVLAGGVVYDMDIDANNGNILQYKQKNIRNYDNNNNISADKANEIAMAKVGKGQVVRNKIDYDDNRTKYEITIVDSKYKYEVDVDAVTGNIVDYEQKNIYFNKIRKTGDMMTAQKAIEIAQANAGVGTVIKCELDYDDDYKVATYDIEIVSENIKHEYEINAIDGTILEYEIDYR